MTKAFRPQVKKKRESAQGCGNGCVYECYTGVSAGDCRNGCAIFSIYVHSPWCLVWEIVLDFYIISTEKRYKM